MSDLNFWHILPQMTQCQVTNLQFSRHGDTMRTNWLASFFDWNREVIEAAETPFAKFAIFVLPILSPVVPAFVTGLRLHTELDFPLALATITALVLEMLGYVGAIAFIKSIYKKFKSGGSWLSVLLNGLAYSFYVFAMYQINVRLGFLAGDSPIVNQVFALLSFITIPTGLLAAEHLTDRTILEEQRELRAERRSERIERYRIKNERPQRTNTTRTNRTPNSGRTNEKRERIAAFVRSVQANEHRTPGPSEISRELGVAKSYASETLGMMLPPINTDHNGD